MLQENAHAKIEGNTVVVWSDAVSAPAAVRYGWANHPVGNLFGLDGKSLAVIGNRFGPAALPGANQAQEIQNSGFAPSNSAESAMIVTLIPGNYTAIVQDVNGTSGVGIVEVFVLQ